jgi:hypothetical protein
MDEAILRFGIPQIMQNHGLATKLSWRAVPKSASEGE